MRHKKLHLSSPIPFMKIALTPEGKQIEASAAAPAQAVCPHCGGVVLLRGRRVMGSDEKSYYWRHAPGSDPNCPARYRVLQPIFTKIGAD
jgi:DNA-directed RNA polymerase subunit RPC12/RpoP